MNAQSHLLPETSLADYVVATRYARYRPDLGRRETFAEIIRRVESMHREFLHDRLGAKIGGWFSATAADPEDHGLLQAVLRGHAVGEVIGDAFVSVHEKRVLPSMRSLQFGGEGILRNHARMFNCAFSAADRIEFFREYFFLLLSGVGCGFSVQHHHVDRLPPVLRSRERSRSGARELSVEPSIEGWARALDAVVRSHCEGPVVRLRFPAPTDAESGEFAGEVGSLRAALDRVEGLLQGASGRRLRPIEVYDLCLFVSRAVLDAGRRRAASICLFSADDLEMRGAKTGNWQVRHPQRAACNNSAVLSPTRGDAATFRALLEVQREFGEPGLLFTDGPDYGCNPCGEAGLHPVLSGPLDAGTVRRLRHYGYAGNLDGRGRLSGWQMCNLSTINGRLATDAEEFLRACVHASVLGTVQAAYTNIPFLGPVTRVINESDALLGVSICGFMDNPELLFSARLLERGARLCRATNQLVAAALGINPAARVTCVKPEGTTSLVLDAAPGIHPRPARRYFRRVRVEATDPAARLARRGHAGVVERTTSGSAAAEIVVFPVESPAQAITRGDLSAVEFLRRVLEVQRHWVTNGEAPKGRSPDLHHNVSQTCAVRADEWPEVAEFVWAHRGEFMGLAFLGDEAAARYPDAPWQPVISANDDRRWRRLRHRAAAVPLPESAFKRPEPAREFCLRDACGA